MPTTKRRRIFRDADPFFRCRATITLPDKSTAQCGRRYNDAVRMGSGRLLCAQHNDIALKTGKNK